MKLNKDTLIKILDTAISDQGTWEPSLVMWRLFMCSTLSRAFKQYNISDDIGFPSIREYYSRSKYHQFIKLHYPSLVHMLIKSSPGSKLTPWILIYTKSGKVSKRVLKSKIAFLEHIKKQIIAKNISNL